MPRCALYDLSVPWRDSPSCGQVTPDDSGGQDARVRFRRTAAAWCRTWIARYNRNLSQGFSRMSKVLLVKLLLTASVLVCFAVVRQARRTQPLLPAHLSTRESRIHMLRLFSSTPRWTRLQSKVGAMPTKAATCTSGNITVTIRTARRSTPTSGSPGPGNSMPWRMRNGLPTTAVRSSCWPAGSRRPRGSTEAGATLRRIPAAGGGQ